MSEIFGNGVMGGGGLTNSKLALANAQAADVRSGKKFYAGDKQIKTGTLADVTQATPAITVSATGLITASATQSAGVVAAGTKSATKQLVTVAAKTVNPTTSEQTAVASLRFTTGDVKVAAVNGIIRVTFPAGSTCTCKNGSTTFTSNASTGVAVFIVPNTGTWTLTATDGTKTATKTVSITGTSRSANVMLTYEYVIFNSGGLNSAYSDGGGGATVTVTTDSRGVKILKFPAGGGYDKMAYLKPAVNLTGYKTLKISGFATADRKFGVWKTVPDSNNAGMTASVVIKQGTSKSSYTIDVSSLTGNYYLGTQYATGDTTVYELILE